MILKYPLYLGKIMTRWHCDLLASWHGDMFYLSGVDVLEHGDHVVVSEAEDADTVHVAQHVS